MKLYRTRTNTVEAKQLNSENIEEVAAWCNGVQVKEQDSVHRDRFYNALNVPTAGGNVRCSEGQYVVRTNGGFVVYGAGHFEREFEPYNDHDFEGSAALDEASGTMDLLFGPRRI